MGVVAVIFAVILGAIVVVTLVEQNNDIHRLAKQLQSVERMLKKQEHARRLTGSMNEMAAKNNIA